MAIVEWPGTDEEKLAMYRAVRANCACERRVGVLVEQCGAHSLLVPKDNKWNRLVFMRRSAHTLLFQEFGITSRDIYRDGGKT